MLTRTGGFVLALALAAGLGGCATTDRTPPGSTGAGGDEETGGSGGSGAGGSGGKAGSGGGAGAGGRAGSGGAAGSGGMAGAGGSGAGGTGVTTTGGQGGAEPARDGGTSSDTAIPSADSGAGGSGGEPPRPSAGCGKANPTVGKRMIMTGNSNQSYWVALPPNYDPNKPYPLGFAFHGFGLNDKTCHDGSECPGFRTVVGANAITVFPKSISGGWEYPVVYLPQNVKYVEDLIALMKSEYCVDDRKIFVSGVSSGGHFVHHLACQMGDRLWAAIPIAA